MLVFTPRPQRSVNILPLQVGVFEDDALLLRLADRSRLAETGWSRASGQINSDDLALEAARRVDSAAWDF